MSNAGSFNGEANLSLNLNFSNTGLKDIKDTLKEIAKGKDLQHYWKDVESATDDAARAIEKYSENVESKNLASDFLKQINAIRALTKKENLSEIFPNIDVDFEDLVIKARAIAPRVASAFSKDVFEQAFRSFQILKDEGVELFDVFDKLADYSHVVSKNFELRNKNNSLESLFGDSDIEKLKKNEEEIRKLRQEAEETFEAFLKLNKIERTDYWGNENFSEFFDDIKDGTLTATEAIARFKTQYGHLLEESFKSSNNTFGLDQLQEFSDKLDSIFHQVEETSNKINSIIENGVIAKSVQNLSEDTSLSDPQRSLFGYLLKDEESLKSVTTLFQKLIEESQKTKNTDVFNEGQFEEIKKLFQNIEQSLSAIKGVLVDVGDGEELSPLLKKLEEIGETSANIKVGFSFDLGDGVNERLNQRVSQATTRQLEAYRNLFSAMKSTGKTNKEMLQFFEPDNASVSELIGMYKSIIKRATEQFKIGNSNIYKDYLGSIYDELQKEVKRASDQLSRAQKKQSDNGILSELFGLQDLSGVIEQLKEISKKLEEISTSAKKFAESFKGGLNITTSIAEVETLTNRVKELEEELAKLKSATNNISPVSQVKENTARSTSETNISSGSTETIVEENSVLQQQETQIGEVNEGLEQEKSLLDQLIERIEKIRMLGVVGGGKSEEEILKNYGQESTDHKALRMQLDGLKTLTPSGKVNPDIRDMVFNPEIPTEEVAKKLLDAAQCYQDCKNALDKLFADNNIVGGKVYNDAYRFLDLFSDDALQMASVVGETREKLTVMRSEQSNISSENLEAKSLEELIQLYHELGTTTGTEGELSKISDAILNIVQAEKQLDASEMQTFVNVLKGLTFVDGDSPILETPYSVDQATAILGNLSSAIGQQSELQGELKETEAQAEQTAQAVNEVGSFGQMKDAFQGETGSGNVTKIGENLKVSLQNQVAQYNKLIEESEKYGSVTREITEELKRQRDLIAEQNEKGVYIARSTRADGKAFTADDYYDARDSYKINKSILGSYKTDSKDLEIQLATYNELIDTIKRYKVVATKIERKGSTEALDEELATLQVRIEELQNSPILSEKQIQASYDMLNKIEDRLVNIQETTAHSIIKDANSSISSYNGKIDSYNKTIDRLQSGGWSSDTFVTNIKATQAALVNYENSITELKQKAAQGIVTREDIDNVKNLETALNNAIKTIKGMSAAEKGYDFLSGQKELDKIYKILKEHTAMSAEAKAQIRAYYKEIESGNPSATLDVIHGKIMKIVNAETDAGRGGKSLLSVIKDKAWYGLASQIGMYFGLNDFIRYIREGIDVVTELDTALTEMRKVSDETVTSLKAYQETTFDVADAVGTTAVQIQNSTADFMRLGESMDEAAESAKTANILMNVSEFESIDDATSALTSMAQAYQDLDKMTIVDKLNEVGKIIAQTYSNVWCYKNIAW